MSIFDDSLRIWGNLQAYGNIEGVDAFMRDFETKTLENIHLSTVLKKAKKLDDVSKPENCFDGSKNVDSSKKTTSARQTSTSTVGKANRAGVGGSGGGTMWEIIELLCTLLGPPHTRG